MRQGGHLEAAKELRKDVYQLKITDGLRTELLGMVNEVANGRIVTSQFKSVINLVRGHSETSREKYLRRSFEELDLNLASSAINSYADILEHRYKLNHRRELEANQILLPNLVEVYRFADPTDKYSQSLLERLQENRIKQDGLRRKKSQCRNNLFAFLKLPARSYSSLLQYVKPAVTRLLITASLLMQSSKKPHNFPEDG